MSNAALSLILLPGKHVWAEYHRVETEFYGRRYPILLRPEDYSDPQIPEWFRSLPEQVTKTLPFEKLQPTEQAQKPRLFQAYNDSLTVIEKMHEQAAAFTAEILKANVEVRTDWYTDKTKHALMQQKVRGWGEEIHSFAFKRPGTLRSELAIQLPFAIKQALSITLRECVDSLVTVLTDFLDRLVDLEQVGLIEWQDDQTCCFHFYRHVITQRQMNLRQITDASSAEKRDGNLVKKEHKVVTTTERDMQRTYSIARHVHEVVMAEPHPYPNNVARPARVNTLLQGIPPWLHPLVSIVTGNEIYRRVIERDLPTEEFTEKEESVRTWEESLYRPDPAVTLGHFVLTGWDDSEK